MKTMKWFVNLLITLISIPIYAVGIVTLLIILALEIIKPNGTYGVIIKESIKNIKKGLK